ncbi:MAG: hypothetical protein JO053_08740 [Acidobacteria bacterium]|nr:hypothetical protein [Acidobacteriota bacterium]
MNSNLVFECRPKYLYALLQSETITPHRVRAYLGAISEKCRAFGQNRVLIERDIPCALNSYEYLEMADEMIRYLKGIKTVWVNPYPELREQLDFLALTGNNRGGCFAIASSIDEAEEWLHVDHCSACSPIVYRAPHTAAAA